MNVSKVRQELAKHVDDEHQVFISRAIPTDRPILGVRVPTIREIAKKVPLENYPEFLNFKPVSLEELLFRGMLIARLPYEKMLEVFDSQVLLIDDWCSCDTFCSGLKPLIKKHREGFFEQKIDPLLKTAKEFPIRVGLVLLLGYISPEYLQVIFDRVESLKNREEYYVKMAIAWLVAECFIKYPEETMGYLHVSKLPAWTFNKTISKICDSFRVEDDAKKYLKTIKKV